MASLSITREKCTNNTANEGNWGRKREKDAKAHSPLAPFGRGIREVSIGENSPFLHRQNARETTDANGHNVFICEIT